ncbi:RNase adapter RapZ [Roseovarius sp. SCSIO 43702]|nr:RNase adapter RapZ [Roseovarius sp. SCSIO 43702]
MTARGDTLTDLASLVLVTGPSGAGRTTALHALEDLGYETIDNLPLSFLSRLLEGTRAERPLALGVDVRTRDFSPDGLVAAMDDVRRLTGAPVQLLYLDADPDTLLRRYSETRRRHPLAPEAGPAMGIAREIELLAPVRALADVLVDTSGLSPNDLRAEMRHWFAVTEGQGLVLSVQSFSYKRGLPRSADLVFDCRFLRNPHWEPELRHLDGRDPPVARFIEGDPRAAEFRERCLSFLRFLVPAYGSEGKSYLTIAFGCTGGWHRSVAMAESVARTLAEEGLPVSIRHRELERLAGRDATAAMPAGSRNDGDGTQ